MCVIVEATAGGFPMAALIELDTGRKDGPPFKPMRTPSTCAKKVCWLLELAQGVGQGTTEHRKKSDLISLILANTDPLK